MKQRYVSMTVPSGSGGEIHTEIVKRWNEKVNNGDTVYILGDVSMRGKNESNRSGGDPEGKVLIRGNHDDVSMSWYYAITRSLVGST